jgi:hypothetical protein
MIEVGKGAARRRENESMVVRRSSADASFTKAESQKQTHYVLEDQGS